MVSSSSPSLRSPAFSLAEFNDLVSSALDSDRFTDPVLSFRLPLSSRSQPTLILAGKSTLDGGANYSRSPRQIFDELKRRASALMMRSPPRNRLHVLVSPNTAPTLTVSSPNSFQSTSSLDNDENNYIPYLPLAAQYELESPHSTSISTSIPRNQSHNIFSRRPSPSLSSSPSTRSCSSSSTSDRSPITPHTPLFSDSQNSDRGRPRSTSTFGTDEDGNLSEDPFAKGNVQIVRSGDTSSSSHSPSSSSSRLRLPKRSARLAPISPPPSCPLPSPPCSPEMDVRHCEKKVKWTLGIEVPSESSREIGPNPEQHTRGRTMKKEREKEDWTLSLPLSYPSPSLCPSSWSKTSLPLTPSPPRTRARRSTSNSALPHLRSSPSPSPILTVANPTGIVRQLSLPPPEASDGEQLAGFTKKRSGSPFPLSLRHRACPGFSIAQEGCTGMERIFGDLMVAAGVQDISNGDCIDFDSSNSNSELKGTRDTEGVDGDVESMISGVFYSARSSLNL